MPLMEWSERFSVNIKEIDEQHKKLVDLFNYLYDTKETNKEKEVISEILNELKDYINTHFKSEEELIKRHEYPEYEAHKSKHDELVERVASMQKKYLDGDTHIVSSVSLLLTDWLLRHINMEDKKYAEFLNAKGVF